MEIGWRVLLSKLHRHGAVSLSGLMVIALIIHPVPFCFDCEFSNPWGHVSTKGDDLLMIWLLISPFLAGLFALRMGWLVAIAAVLAILISQPLGGVAWWSLRDNEGPIILLFGLPATTACFGIGYLARSLVAPVRNAFSSPIS
jgi:hypothetical protein